MIGKPGFWTALDYLHNYIAANVSDWKTAKIDLPDGAGTVEMDASHIRDSLWADCTKPLREVIDRTMVKPRVEEIEGKTKSAPGADNTGDGHQEQKL